MKIEINYNKLIAFFLNGNIQLLAILKSILNSILILILKKKIHVVKLEIKLLKHNIKQLQINCMIICINKSEKECTIILKSY